MSLKVTPSAESAAIIAEEILKGDHDVTWGMLYELRRLYEYGAVAAKPALVDSLDKDTSLVEWVNSIMMSEACGNANGHRLASISFSSFDEVCTAISSGVLLCHIVSVLLKIPIAPSHFSPTSPAQCLTNIRRALSHISFACVTLRSLVTENVILHASKRGIRALMEGNHAYMYQPTPSNHRPTE